MRLFNILEVIMNRNAHKILLLTLTAAILTSGCSLSQSATHSMEGYQGMIEAKDVDLNTKVPGLLAECIVEEGDSVKIGDIIARIDAKDLAAKKEGLVAQASAASAAVEAAKAQLEAARSQQALAKATLEKVRNGARDQELKKLQASYDVTYKTYLRIKDMAAFGAASQQQLDEAETKLKVAEQDLALGKEGARKEDVAAAEAQYQAASAAVLAAHSNVLATEEKHMQAIAGIKEVETYLVDASIKSPINGMVTTVNVNDGELVSTGMSLATITDLNDIWVELQIPETELAVFNEGQNVSVQVPAYPDKKIDGKIVRIASKPNYAVHKASNENGSYDLVTYAVKISLKSEGITLRPGMTSFVTLK